MQPPDYLTGRAREIWDETAPAIAANRWTPAGARQLSRYCDMVSHYEKANRIAAESPPILRGNDGNWAKNPVLQTVQDLARSIRLCARDLGLAADDLAGPNEQALRNDLGARADLAYGRLAITLARQLDNTDDPASAAAVARELRLLLVEIGRSVPETVRSELDELRARRAARETGSG